MLKSELNVNEIDVKYRTYFKGIPPQPIKLQIPGWAGVHNKHTNGDEPQPWHCPPFVSGSTYGLELIYPFDTECRVIRKDGNVIFEGDFSNESPWSETGKPASPPFMSFAPNHYGFTSSLDIMPPDNCITRLEPHPRFYTDTTGTCPIAITGHIAPWWSKIFFVVFKSPREGETHIFRYGEPYAQLLILHNKVIYNIKEMTIEEQRTREKLSSKIDNLTEEVANKIWHDYRGNKFNDRYKVLSKIAQNENIDDYLNNKTKIKESKKKPIKKMPRKFFK